MRKKLFDNKPHPDIASSLNNVGESYKNLGGFDNLKKGLQLLELALEMRKKLFDNKAHPDIATSLNNVGIGYVNLGGSVNLKKGLQLQE